MMQAHEVEIGQGLTTWYREAEGETVTISKVERLTGGWETDVYAFEATRENGAHEALVVRLFPRGNEAKAQREFEGMQALAALGYPVPRVHRAGKVEDSPFGLAFFVMDKVEGQALMPMLENAPLPRVQRLFAEFCRHFAALHRLEWQQYFMAEFDIQDPYAFIDRSLAYLRRWTEHYGVADFGVLEAWFQAGREQAKCERYGLCHNDFHPMNVLVNEQEQMVVIDWANIEIGDPRIDLAWTLMLIRVYKDAENAQMILDLYQAAWGETLQALDYFLAMACTRRLQDLWVSLTQGAEHAGMRPGAEEIMRQEGKRLEAVYQILQGITQVNLPSIEKLIGDLA